MFEILMNKSNEQKEIVLIENGKLVEYYANEENSNRREGNIYIGIVRNILNGMQAAFVDIGTEKNSFIHLKDILPKVDEKKEKLKQGIDIKDVAKPGQKILVQVKKNSNNQKGARVSTHINLPSKYIALMPNTDIITVSQKIEDKKEQERLIKLVKENLSKGNGAVIRTSAIGKEKELIEDIKNVEKKWSKIEKSFKNDKENKPKLIAKSKNILEKMIIDLPEKSIKNIITNDSKEYKKIKKFKEENNYLDGTNIELKENQDVMDIYDINKEISKIENRKIWLKCGGFITIDKCEALTAIDVNSGKFTGKEQLEDTVLKVNLEATKEIAKQMRLRDIGGIIVVDFIDMEKREDRDKVREQMIEEIKSDRSKVQVLEFTKLGLLEITRKHILGR